MAPRITDLTGTDLGVQPPPTQFVVAVANGNASVTIQCLLVESEALPFDFISGTLFWDDGTPPVVYASSTGTISVNASRSLAPGNHLVRVTAMNYVPPAGETSSVNFSVTVSPAAAIPQSTPLLYGPILPKDAGYPNSQQWDWNSGNDTDVLVSSVKMLLLTAKGERIMLPSYGTNLRAYLFQPNVSGLSQQVEQEIASALMAWEPRVALHQVGIIPGDRSITLICTLLSKLDQTTVTIPLTYVK